MPKAITIDDLAVMIKHGFDETAKQAEVNKRFEEVDKRFEAVDTRLEHMDKRLNHIDMRLDHTDATITVMQRDVAEIRQHFVYRDEFEDALARLSLVEKTVGIQSGK